MACGKGGESIVAKPIEIQSPQTTPLSSPPSQRSKVESNKELTNKDGPSTQYEHLKVGSSSMPVLTSSALN